MSFDLNAINAARAAHLLPERSATRPAGAGFADALEQSGDATVDAIPAAPPPAVMQEVLAAQHAIQDMHDRGRQLHFEMDSGRVKILLQDLDGNVIREIPPSHALELASGKAVE